MARLTIDEAKQPIVQKLTAAGGEMPWNDLVAALEDDGYLKESEMLFAVRTAGHIKTRIDYNAEAQKSTLIVLLPQ